MKFKIVIFLQLFSFITFAQESVCYLKIEDITIVRADTKNAINCGNANFTKKTIVSTFGEPTSTNIEEVEAAGGKIETIYYGQDYFYVPKKKNASSGFRISTSTFYLVMKDSLEIKIGEDIEKLFEIFCKKRHYKNEKAGNSRFGIPYIGYFKIPFSNSKEQGIIETDQSLTITYDPQSLRVIEMSKADRY